MIYGDRHTGKHAFITDVLKMEERPVYIINSSEFLEEDAISQSSIVKAMRICSSVIFKENLKIIVGEVVALTATQIHLRTKDMESVFEIGNRMRNEIQKERVSVGDIIEIYKESGFINRIGRSSGEEENSIPHPNTFQMPIPEGEIVRTELMTSIMSLDELDVINSKEDGHECLYMNVEISGRIRSEVNLKIAKWINESKASFTSGILVVEDSQFLNEEAFSTLCEMIKHPYSPHLIFIYNGIPHFKNCGELRLKISPIDHIRIIEALAAANNLELEDQALKLLESYSNTSNIALAIDLMRISANSDNKVSAEAINRMLSIFESDFS